MKNSLRLFFIFGALTLTGVSCKSNVESSSEGTSNFKTLDNFAAGKTVRINECKGNSPVLVPDDRIVLNSKIFQGADSIKVSAEYRGYVKEYLSSVPTDLQRVFVALNGEILITDKASEICGTPFSDKDSAQYIAPERRQIESCFVYATNKGKTKSWFTVIHSPDVKSIRHGGIRVFGSIYAQFIPRLALNSDASSAQKFVLLENETQEFSGYKLRISAKFLSDINSKGIYDLNNLKSLLGDNVKVTVSTNLKRGVAPLEGLVIKYENDEPALTVTDPEKINIIRKRFDDFVFAEAFDSFRCSSKSLAVMKSEFPNTYAEYDTLDKNILAVAKAIADKLDQRPSPSLALSDGAEVAPQAHLQGFADILSMFAPLLSGSSSKPASNDPNSIVSQSGSSGSTAGQVISQLPWAKMFSMMNDMGASLASAGCQGGSCQCAGGCAGGCTCQSGGGCSSASGGCATCPGAA